jgi:hypothetical protein
MISRKTDRSFRTQSAGRALLPSLEMEGVKKGENSYFFLPSNLFGLLSLASRVFDNNGSGGISAHANRPTGWPTACGNSNSSYSDTRQIRSSHPHPPRWPTEIYLPRKSTGG